MRQCPDCGKTAADSANICPYCGFEFRTNPLKILLFVAGLGVTLWMIAGLT